MKIVLASDTYSPNVNGAAFFTERLAHKLAERGHDVYVIAPAVSFRTSVKKIGKVTECRVRSLPVLTYPDFRFSPPPTVKPVVARFIKKINPDIIHVQNHFMIGKAVTGAARRLSIPIVGTNHFMPENLVHFLHLPKNLEAQVKKLAWRDCINLYRTFSAVTTPTQTAAKLLKDHGFPNAVQAISCGIDLKRFTKSNNGAYIRKQYHLPKRPLLLYVGRIEREKRIDVIIKALPFILKRADIQFVVAGFGTQQLRLERLAKQLGVSDHITFTGFVSKEDLPNLYAEAEVFVNAGIAELQSIVTMEAMASALPVLAADAMALPELVAEGRNGFLFADKDSELLAYRATQLFTNDTLRAEMSAQSLALIKKHDIDTVITEFESLYEHAIGAHQKKPIVSTRRARRNALIPAALGILATVVFSGTILISRNPESVSMIKNESKQMITSVIDSIQTSSAYQTIHSTLQEWGSEVNNSF